MLEKTGGDYSIVVRCKKDQRHGHAKKGGTALCHRADIDDAKITWPGVGVMSPEVEAAWVARHEKMKRKQGADTWNGP